MVASAAPRALVSLLALLLGGCETRFAQTAEEPQSSSSCPASLSERLTIAQVALSADIRYRRRGYDNIATDERIALALGQDGRQAVAWLQNSGDRVHITPLTESGEVTGLDTVVSAIDVGGLVAQSDGYMLLARVNEPGPQQIDPNGDITGPNTPTTATATLMRFRNGAQAYAPLLLTGPAQVSEAPAGFLDDCATVDLNGRLAFNGSTYGAYFVVHGCSEHTHASFYGDKLVYADDNGNIVPGGWSWNCSTNYGIQLIPETGGYTPFCLSTSDPNPGLNLVPDGAPAVQLAVEATTAGYVGGQFGSALKLADRGYAVSWLSRGGTAVDPMVARKASPDIALMGLDSNFGVRMQMKFLEEKAGITETNLHVAPYGPDRLLFVWEGIDITNCVGQTCFGNRNGTHFRLSDLSGNFVSPDEVIEAPPNAADDLLVFPNADIGWAFVPDDARSYAAMLPIDAQGVPQLPTKNTLAVAHLRYCK